MELDAKVAGWLATLAEQIAEAVEYNPGYGTFYIEEIKIGFEGEASNISLVPAEGSHIDIRMGD